MTQKALWKSGSIVVLTIAVGLVFNGCTEYKKPLQKAYSSKQFIVTWTGDEDGANPDFVTVIDADPHSPNYGKVISTKTLPEGPAGANMIALLPAVGFKAYPSNIPSSVLNEPHHVSDKLTKNKDFYMGGLISGNIFKVNLASLPTVPDIELIGSPNPPAGQTAIRKIDFTGSDDFRIVSRPEGDYVLATFMGGRVSKAADLKKGGGPTQTPGGLVLIKPDGTFIDFDATTPPVGQKPVPANIIQPDDKGKDIGQLANPHGIDVRMDLKGDLGNGTTTNGLVITSDYADPLSLVTAIPSPYATGTFTQKLRTTVRLWDLGAILTATGPTSPVRPYKVIQMPDGPRIEKQVPIHEEPAGLMSTGLLHQGDHKGAFAASMCGGVLFYSADITVANPVFKEVFDFGPCAGASVFTITPDDKYLIIPIAGIESPGDPTYNAGRHNYDRRVVQLDIQKLLDAGTGFACNAPLDGTSGKPNNEAADCPTVLSEVKVNSDLNFLSHGGPHLVVLNSNATRVAFSNYFVDLSLGFNFPGANLALHGSGSNGDHRVYIANFNPVSHKLELDSSFRDEYDGLPGINFNRIHWPHGDSGYAKPHGLIFVEF
ncbi:MAG TPA: hypothetical protein VN944_10430 [Nitrospiria bacterium]|nr:hypothetical protein [Nitrospiria bacterium]